MCFCFPFILKETVKRSKSVTCLAADPVVAILILAWSRLLMK